MIAAALSVLISAFCLSFLVYSDGALNHNRPERQLYQFDLAQEFYSITTARQWPHWIDHDSEASFMDNVRYWAFVHDTNPNVFHETGWVISFPRSVYLVVCDENGVAKILMRVWENCSAKDFHCIHCGLMCSDDFCLVGLFTEAYKPAADIKGWRFSDVLTSHIQIYTHSIVIVQLLSHKIYVYGDPWSVLCNKQLARDDIRLNCSIGRIASSSVGSGQIFYLDKGNDGQDTRERRQERGEDSRPSFRDDAYESVPLLLVAFYGFGILIGVYIVWQFKLWPGDEDNRGNDHSCQRDRCD